MSGKKSLIFCLSLVFFISSLPLNSFFQEKTEIENVKLPPEWTIQKSLTVPHEKLDLFSQRLGGELISAVNYFIDANGMLLRVNVAEAKTKQDAQKIYQTFLSLHKKEEECLLKEKKVFEFISSSFQLIKLANTLFRDEGSLDPDLMRTMDQSIWEAKILAAPIEKADYMSVNDMFILMKTYRENPDDTEIHSKINELKEKFKFSNEINLRYEIPSWGSPEYSIEKAEKTKQKGDTITFKVKDPKTHLGIPCIEITAKIPVKKSCFYKPSFGINKKDLISSSPYWPTDSQKIHEILGKILKTEMNTEQKVKAIHGWVSRNLKFGEEKVGSRYGALHAISQGFGRCWDFGDVFITLCRAAKIPARQVMGWVYEKSGHVWAEVFLPEKGWFPIDPTIPSSSVTTDYVPFFISEDGELPAIYWTEPLLRRVHE